MAYQTNVLRNTIIHTPAPKVIQKFSLISAVSTKATKTDFNRDEGDEGDRENSLNTLRHSGRDQVAIRNPVEFVIRIGKV